MGLAEIIFPNLNYNINSLLNMSVTVSFNINNGTNGKNVPIIIPEGPYTAEDDIKAFNKELKAIKVKYWGGEIIRSPFCGKLRFNPQSKKIVAVLKGGELL